MTFFAHQKSLFYISHIGGGEHPPHFTVLERLCVKHASAGLDAKGQKQHLLSLHPPHPPPITLPPLALLATLASKQVVQQIWHKKTVVHQRASWSPPPPATHTFSGCCV